MNTQMAKVAAALARLPQGTVTGRVQGCRYIATKSVFSGGKSIKLVAQELGGSDYISLNYYDLERGARLAPCEMSREKVINFILDFQPDQADAA